MKGLRQVIALLFLSTGVILAMSYAQHAIQGLLAVHDLISQGLMEVFSGGKAGTIARSLIALLTVPIVVALIPTGIYWLLRRHWFPYFSEIVWVVWLIQASALIVAFK